MTTPAPMTAEQIVEALCDAQAEVDWAADAIYSTPDDDVRGIAAAIAKRDRIKAALVEWMEAWDGACEDVACSHMLCASWRKLEEACGGKA